MLQKLYKHEILIKIIKMIKKNFNSNKKKKKFAHPINMAN